MGSPITNFATHVVEDVAPKVTSWLRGYMGNMSKEMNFEHPQWGHIDKALNESLESYARIHQQAMPQLEKPITETWNAIKAHPALDAAHGSGKTSIAQIHADLMSMGHPASNFTTMLMARSKNAAAATLPEMSGRIPSEARLIAQAKALGPHNEYISPHFYDLYSMSDPKAWAHADAMADIFSAMTHDKTPVVQKGIQMGTRSQTKFDIARYVGKINKLKTQAGDLNLARKPGFDVGKYIYEPPSAVERKVTRWMHQVAAPFVAIPHIGTVFNLGSAPIGSWGKALVSMSDQNFRDTLAQTGILASTMHSIMDQAIRDETGVVSKVAGHRAANILGQMFHNPGFQRVRLTQIMFGGAVGYHAIQEWAEKAVSGNKRAIAELRQLHLDPAAIAQRGGKLTNEELGNAIWHFTNDRFFLDKQLQRSLYSNSNKFMRTAAMFHAFVGYQANFMKNELGKLLKTDPLALAQYVGTIGVLFPNLAPFMKSAEMLLRTGNPEEAKDSISEDYETLYGGEGVERFNKYIELITYLGAFGTLTSYYKAAKGNRLANQVMGPIIGTGVRTAQDAFNVVHGESHNVKPLARDVIRYAIPVGGGPLQHILFPPE